MTYSSTSNGSLVTIGSGTDSLPLPPQSASRRRWNGSGRPEGRRKDEYGGRSAISSSMFPSLPATLPRTAGPTTSPSRVPEHARDTTTARWTCREGRQGRCPRRRMGRGDDARARRDGPVSQHPRGRSRAGISPEIRVPRHPQSRHGVVGNAVAVDVAARIGEALVALPLRAHTLEHVVRRRAGRSQRRGSHGAGSCSRVTESLQLAVGSSVRG